LAECGDRKAERAANRKMINRLRYVSRRYIFISLRRLMEMKMENKKQVAEAKILDANGTYFINGSILPVYINEYGDTYLVEEYEKGFPCAHVISDLFKDGVLIIVNPIGYN
jgi:hypothetical protein